MGASKKEQTVIQSFDNASATKKKRFPKLRHSVHQNGDILLILIHSLFPLGIGAYLIGQELLTDHSSSSSVFFYLGYLTGSGDIALQLTMIARALTPGSAAKFMDCLTFTVAVFQFLVCSIGAALTFVFTGRAHDSVAAVSAASIIFCILPAFLAITSLMNAHTYSEKRGKISYEASFASGRSKPPVIIKRISSDVMHSEPSGKYYLNR
ncbi:hypothetical protein Aperf_G00000129360 [Anoplocephala perfoliata]